MNTPFLIDLNALLQKHKMSPAPSYIGGGGNFRPLEFTKTCNRIKATNEKYRGDK